MFRSSAIAAGTGTGIQVGDWHTPISIEDVDFVYTITRHRSGEALVPARLPVHASSPVTLLESRDQKAPQLAEMATPAIRSASLRRTAEQTMAGQPMFRWTQPRQPQSTAVRFGPVRRAP